MLRLPNLIWLQFMVPSTSKLLARAAIGSKNLERCFLDANKRLAMRKNRPLSIPALLLAILVCSLSVANAAPRDTIESVVSVLPVWPGRAQGGAGAAPGATPEGSGVVLRNGVIATAWHVIQPASSIDVRLSDGRILPAKLIAKDISTDIALLKVEIDAPSIEVAPAVELAEPVCAIGNAYGFGLSVTCGVVSAVDVTNAGFNEVEDFIQTDAAVNPGMSGGALVDSEGRLVGMISAIFSSKSETNIGVNFAVSPALLLRVADALLEDGTVRYPQPGWQLGWADRSQMRKLAAPIIRSIDEGGSAAQSNMRKGDLVVRIGDRRTRTPKDAIAALAIVSGDAESVDVEIIRDGETIIKKLMLWSETPVSNAPAIEALGSCPHPKPVCIVRQAVFPVSSFDPVGSATRIGTNLLVTNRHIVGNRMDAVVHTPDGPRGARVVPSAFTGDLVLLEVSGLPENGYVPDLEIKNGDPSVFYSIGADVDLQEVRVFDPGGLIARPAESSPLARLHVSARMQPGVSGGALVDETGDLHAIAVGGGEGRYEAIPVASVHTLLDLRSDENAEELTKRLGTEFALCAQFLESLQSDAENETDVDVLIDVCTSAKNQGQLLETGRLLAQLGNFDAATTILSLAAEQVPNSINARISLLVALQLSASFTEMTQHARWLMALAPDDPQALRFAIQSGVWGGEPALAEEGYRALLKADPKQAEAARRFIDNAPPAPKRQ